MDLISVIIPAFNAEKFIKRTVESVINQTYTNIEVIIVDDGSTDKTKEICQELEKEDRRIKLFSKENEGVSEARNFGINYSNGKYIMFLDADDKYEKDIVKNMYQKMIEENVDIVRANYYIKKSNVYRKNNERFEIKKYNKNEIREYLIPAILEEKIRCYVWLLMIKRELVVKFHQELHIFEDANFYLEVFAKAVSIYLMNETLYCYCTENETSLTKQNIEKNIDNMLLANKVIKNTLKKYQLDTLENTQRIDTRILIDIVNYIYVIQYQKNFRSSIKKYKQIKENKIFKGMIHNYISIYGSKKENVFTKSIIKNYYLIFYCLCIIKNLKNKGT